MTAGRMRILRGAVRLQPRRSGAPYLHYGPPTPAAASAEPAQAKSGKAKHHGKKKTDTEPAQSNPNATPLETASDA